MIRSVVIGWFLLSTVAAAGDRVAPPPPLDSGIVAAARVYPGVRFTEGWRDPYLVQMAEGYAAGMAAINSQSRVGQGHFGWERRRADILRVLGLRGDEVTAESWPWQRDEAPEAIGRELLWSWQRSSGHWRVVSAPARRFGDGVARSRQGVWFGVVIVAGER